MSAAGKEDFMRAEKRRNGKHLTLNDRYRIDKLIRNGLNFKAIGEILEKDPTTISKEVKRHRYLKKARAKQPHPCRKSAFCSRRNICKTKEGKCRKLCRNCILCTKHCKDFVEWKCDRYEKPPYVCNGCERHIYGQCTLDMYVYDPVHAHKAYEMELSLSRQGADRTVVEMSLIETLCAPLIKKGQPLSHIYAYHADEIGISKRTFYRYVNAGYIGLMNIDMRRVVRYKKRKRHKDPKPVPEVKIGHTYDCFLTFREENPTVRIAEMDFVMGKISDRKALLTLMPRDLRLMLIALVERKTIINAIAAIDSIEDALETDVFSELFPVILTDNDLAFAGPARFEANADGVLRTKLFYCDPYRSGQKGALEKNHEYIRYIIPKGKSFAGLTADNVIDIMNHINSTARPDLGGKSPMELALKEFGELSLAKLGMKLIPPDEVCLKPSLIRTTKA